MEIKCIKCDVKLTFQTMNTRFTKISGKRLRSCHKCGEVLEKEMKAELFVEHYNGNDIYCFDGKYVPYWGCDYYFTTLEDCKNRIDSKCAVVNMDMFRTVMHMQR